MLALTLALLALPVTAARAADGETRIIVGQDPGLSGAEKADIRDGAGVALEQRLPIPHAEVVTAPAGDARAALRDLRRDPNVQWAQVDHVRHLTAADSYFGYQWALVGDDDADIDAPEAWLTGADGSGVTVAVVDSGVDTTHEDLVGRFAPTSDWWDFVGGDAYPQDENGHGTHVAGIIAANRDNGIGIAGVAPRALIMPVRVMNAKGEGLDSTIAMGFAWAADHGAQVVNASLGGAGASPLIRAVIQSHPSTLFVVAAGNDGVDVDSTTWDPCDAPYGNVVCVGATDNRDAPACFTNRGRANVDLFAPGVDVVSTWPEALTDAGYDPYGEMSGTSMAAPQVAGVAALAISHAGASAPAGATLAALLDGSVDPINGLAPLSVTGGRINALRAVGGTPTGAGGPGGTWSPCAPATTEPPPSPTSTPSPAPKTAPPASTPAPTPRPTAPPAVDTDGDGHLDGADACPAERAATATGCPVPSLRSVRVSVARHRRLRTRVRANRFATINVRVERRTCRRSGRHHHRRCRYRKVASKTANARSTRLTKKVARGRYRVTVRLHSAAGHGKRMRRTIRVR